MSRMDEALRLSHRDTAEDFNLSNKIKQLWEQKFHIFQVPPMKDKMTEHWRLDHFGPIGYLEEMRSAFGGQWIAPDTEYTRLCYRDGLTEDGKVLWRPMMSDTPSELFDHLEYYNMVYMTNAKRVLIHGLGLGCAIDMALHHMGDASEGYHIDVVELSEEVISIIGPRFRFDERVTIHHGNAFDFRFPPNTKWDVIWHDIWPTICGDNQPEITTLKRRYGGRCKWQGAWSEDRIKAQDRKWKRWRRLNEKG